MKLSLDEFKKRCIELGLDPNTILVHQSRIKNALESKQKPVFPIIDTCRFDNGGLLPNGIGVNKNVDEDGCSGFVAFVPAAGASSRYFASHSHLIRALEDGTFPDIVFEIQELIKKGAKNWPLPKILRQLFESHEHSHFFTAENIRKIKEALSVPKAFLPCVVDDATFLEIKIEEHLAIDDLDGQIFVVGPGQETSFSRHINEYMPGGGLTTRFFEQGPELSTIRFNKNAEPVIEANSRFSIVPAGHGTLTKLLEQIPHHFPKSHSAFIRNIDNVMGSKNEAVVATRLFLATHKKVLDSIKKIRACLDARNLRNAAAAAATLLEPLTNVKLDTQISEFISAQPSVELRTLWEVQCKLFHFHPVLRKSAFKIVTDEFELLKLLYKRPLNSMGQVPNTEKDVGGTPVFAEYNGDGSIKLCLEVPHASPADKEKFLANPEKATHFNPVFAAAELGFPSDQYNESEGASSFWLLAEKPYRGETVYYHESVLYELIGNSIMANVIFVEVPRLVFNPHKAVDSITARKKEDWIG